jgi:lipoprotein NlpI
MTKARLHQEGDQELAEVAQKADLSSWPGPMLKFTMGQITEDALMAAAADPDPQTHVGEACEANFYTGEDALEHQRLTTALARFRAVHDSCIKDYVEYGAALAELKHMTAAPVKATAGPAKAATGPAKWASKP